MYLLYMNQCNTDKQGLEKKIEDIDKKYHMLVIY